MKVGMIGLGAMGLGMATNLAKAGMLKAVYNRTISKANALAVEFDVKVCGSPQQLAEHVDMVMICVAADEDVLQMINAIAETIKPNTIVVDMSTVSSETAKKAAAILLDKQVQFLDAPVSGGVEGARKGALVMMVGGDEETLESARPALEAMSSRIVYMGGTGSGQGTKAVNQIMAAGINQAVTEALAFGQTQGLAMDKVIDVISGGAAGNWFLQHRGRTMTQGTYEPGFKLALHHKDLKICQKMAEQADISIPLVDKTVADYQQLMEQGYADEDISALYRLKSL
ncbi:MAG: NAD(P)-dependent oxidoreductase [Methylococcales bacterium]|nr:NAD(P)-dependent oxidoreductase [Methylococcales bacterium]